MIIVTGASRGIGKFLFESLKSSDKVIGTYLSTKPESIKDLDFLYKVDVSKYESVAQFINVIKNDLTEIVLLNCAGISYNSFTHKSDPEKWKKVIDVNLIGTYHMIRAILPIMREQNYGRIINFSSVIAQKGTPGVSAYAASKAGLWGMTRSLAQENGSMGITVNNINLGYVSLGMGVEQVPQSFLDSIKNQIPSRLFCEPNDIYNTVNYLI
ncbi:MAG: SDR family NAD(P)-dependent oxidoreductase, partial [Synergistaceae bacterium]|nr:SDR family NAD(P)-dependent oxidoreductase [Synergistaceae bacterium]